MKRPDSDPSADELRALHDLGDRDAIAEALLRHAARLERSVRFRMDPALASRVDPADVVQEAVIEALDRFDDWLRAPDLPLFLWLRGLSLQRLLQLRRFHVDAQRRDARRERSFDASSCESLAERLVTSDTSPSSALDREERVEGLLRVLEELSPDDKEVLFLRCIEELSNAEAARVLELNESTASSRFVRALARVQKELRA